MGQRFRFAIISDPHIAQPETIYTGPNRFHLVEVSIPGIEQIFDHLETLDLDFLLLPGDLTQHGEWVNHQWLIDRLKRLPFPAYVVPGNHDVIARDASDRAIGLQDFPRSTKTLATATARPSTTSGKSSRGCGWWHSTPTAFEESGKQIGVGHVDETQLAWLEETLAPIPMT
jgi:3',5'-cyclic AMP phosphodiesterase CpdA